MKHKLGLIGFSYLAGLICAEFFGTAIIGVFIFAAVLLIFSLTVYKMRKSAAALALFTAFAAMCVHGIYTLTVYLPITAYDGKTAEISGVITDVRYYGSDTAAYVIETEINGIKAHINFFGEDSGGSVGDSIKFTVKLSVMKDSGVFAEKSYYKSKGIFLSASPRGGVTVAENSGFNLKKSVSDYSDYIGDKMCSLLTGDEGDLLKAMFLGDKSGLSSSLSDNIKRAGISHFTAVSGLHLTVVSHILLLLISLTPLKNHRYFKFIVLSLLILLFTLFFKLSPSVIRAGIMLIVYYGSEPFMRKSSVINSMGIAVLAVTLTNPYACTDAGFLLSLAGTFGVGAVSPMICKRFNKSKLTPIKNMAAASACAVLCTFPLSCIFFGGISVMGIITNLLLYPLFLPALLCAALFAVFGGNGNALMFVSGLCAKAMIFIIDLIGGFRYAYFTLDYSFFVPVSILSVLFAVFTYLYFKDIKKTLRAAVISLCVMLSFTALSNLYYRDKASLAMYSDGNDACIIAKQEGSVFIAVSDDSQKLLDIIGDYLKSNFIDEVSVIKVINQSNNNLSGFQKIPCREFLPPDNTNEVYSDKITLQSERDRCRIKINGVSVSLSPAKDPVDDGISVIYGYTGSIKDLNGIIFASSKRLYGNDENNIYKNLYYDKASYIITDNGFLRDKG
ncbi:MAG: ComEC family competence protein [Ruminococcaceae bacterium]|nr:ComEC family competence protein [Oscillospiraceae bacterium]